MRRLVVIVLVFVAATPVAAATRLSEEQAERAVRAQAKRNAMLAAGRPRVSVRSCDRVDARTVDCRVRYRYPNATGGNVGACFQTLRAHLTASGTSIRVTRGDRPTRCVAS